MKNLFLACGIMLAIASEAHCSSALFEPGLNNSDDAYRNDYLSLLSYQSEKLETETRISPYRIVDMELEGYVNSIVCKLTPDYCAKIRTYILDSQEFNLDMFPNGMLHVYSEVFLTVRNEDQLAALLSHQIAHYLLNHHIERFQSYKITESAEVLADAVIASTTGFRGVSAMFTTEMVFNEQQEKQAGVMGLDLMRNAGYDIGQITLAWDLVFKEEDDEATSAEKFSTFRTVHSALSNSMSELDDKISLASQQLENKPDAGPQFKYYSTKLFPRSFTNRFNQQSYEPTLKLLTRLANTGYQPSLIHYYFGELYRLRSEEGDKEESVSAYEQSSQLASCPKQVFKHLGYLHFSAQNYDLARQYFARYVDLVPDAEDKAIVNYYMDMAR